MLPNSKAIVCVSGNPHVHTLAYGRKMSYHMTYNNAFVQVSAMAASASVKAPESRKRNNAASDGSILLFHIFAPSLCNHHLPIMQKPPYLLNAKGTNQKNQPRSMHRWQRPSPTVAEILRHCVRVTS